MGDFGRKQNPQERITLPNQHGYETIEEKLATAKGVAKAKQTKFDERSIENLDHSNIDDEIKLRDNTSELTVITKTKKLTSYVITITEKSPKKFRSVFVNRMQNYCLDCLENLIEANSLKMDSTKNKDQRKQCQHNAFLKLKLLSYMAFLSLENDCILKKHYAQISLMLSDCINLLVAWRKSDATRIGK